MPLNLHKQPLPPIYFYNMYNKKHSYSKPSKRLAIFFLAGFSLIFAACRKQCTNADFIYEAERQVLTTKNIFKIGDTIKINYTIPKCGLEYIRDKQLCMEDVKPPRMDLRFFGHDSSELANNSNRMASLDALDAFAVITFKGGLPNVPMLDAFKNRIIYLDYLETADKFLLNIGIVCIKKGFYRFNGSIIYTSSKSMPCRQVRIRDDDEWPRTQITEMLGVSNWQNFIEMQKNFYYIKVI